MKIYDYKWALDVHKAFYQMHPRAKQINKIIAKLLSDDGHIVFESDIEEALVRLIRIPTLGRDSWRYYKVLVKSKSPFTPESLTKNFLCKFTLQDLNVKIALQQLSLPFEEDQN